MLDNLSNTPSEARHMPKVSVIIPCHDDGAYLDDALGSLAAQTYRNFEIIVTNDHSTDPFTIKKLSELQRQGIIVLDSSERGPSAARNVGIRQASGEYIFTLDADDMIDARYLEEAARVLDAQRDVSLCCSNVQTFGLAARTWLFDEISIPKMLTYECIVSSACMFRKEDWKTVGGFDESLLIGYEDFSFWLSLLDKCGKPHHFTECYHHYRLKPKSRSAQLFRNNTEETAAFAVFNAHQDLYSRNVKYFFTAFRKLHDEKSKRECLLSWRFTLPLLRLEWNVRQAFKRILGRA
ncbi:glycosyltransferase family A protein [Nitratidesulfovibrio liaohensis]|uniref:Glycosyltransferase family 2 protein n=1 Tax=Nitratidesulfovibrio liaohensis TaxID=2604158 RepID=A0ABY9QZT2_9BACT|nr:glycosyltransferase family A protein [Nitratidesulfovibrio liaohensis]WMW65036.1 glycosyltransferase family 2 protein [Nitratidesulfovibrio liaohensis]